MRSRKMALSTPNYRQSSNLITTSSLVQDLQQLINAWLPRVQIARPAGRSQTAALLAERRQREDAAFDAAQIEKAARWPSIKEGWVQSTDRKLQANAVRRRFETLLRQSDVGIEARRQKYVSNT